MTTNSNAAVVMRGGAIEIREQNIDALSMQVVKGQVAIIQDLMRSVMKEGEHYGKIPGCGEKKALFKAGAEKLSYLFRFVPEFEISKSVLENGHREYEIKCVLKSMGTDRVVGQGVGSCSTLEGKYRFRPGPVKSTGRPVPKDYWTLQKSDPVKARQSLGGPGLSVKKVDGVWEIVEQGERMEHDNPADYFNTVLKMAKKRAQTDAVLTATAASDIFTQDLDEDDLPTVQEAEEPQQQDTTIPKQSKSPEPGKASDNLRRILFENQISFDDFRRWASETGQIADLDSCGSLADLSEETCARLVKAQKAMISALNGAK